MSPQTTCGNKIKHQNINAAITAMNSLINKHNKIGTEFRNKNLNIYTCPYCYSYHIGHKQILQ